MRKDAPLLEVSGSCSVNSFLPTSGGVAVGFAVSVLYSEYAAENSTSASDSVVDRGGGCWWWWRVGGGGWWRVVAVGG